MATDDSNPETALETVPACQNETDTPATTASQKLGLVYRCKKCRRIVASDDNIVTHERGKGQESFKWKKRSGGGGGGGDQAFENTPAAAAECSSIFVEPMKWMQTVQEGFVGEKLLCMGCNARLGSFNWAGMQCNCGAWINPAFQLHKSRLDECPI